MSGDKQRDLLDGALRVFARDGYSRAGVQALAAEAGVSTRTIYNKYGNKEGLFRAVILDSAERVAERQIALAERLIGRITDPRADLIAFGRAWAAPDPASETHMAMVRHVNADAAHIAPGILAAWRRAGPERVRGALADHLRAHTANGLLTVPPGGEPTAAIHLVQLTAGTVRTAGPEADVEALVRAGVDVFLAAYGRRGGASG
jgi:AcrR family transcriptional regulator